MAPRPLILGVDRKSPQEREEITNRKHRKSLFSDQRHIVELLVIDRVRKVDVLVAGFENRSREYEGKFGQ